MRVNQRERKAYLEEWVLLLRLQSVRTEQLDTTSRLGAVQTRFRTLQQLEDVIYNDGLQIDLVLVV